MYLNMLSDEQKYLFLECELYLSMADGKFSQEEKNIVDAHCMEMQIDSTKYSPSLSYEEVMRRLKSLLGEKEKNIFVLELMGVILAEGVFDNSEEKMINYLADILNVEEQDLFDAHEIINDMKAVYTRCAQYIKGGTCNGST